VVLTTIDSENLKHYFKLKSLLKEHGLKFPKQEALQLYYSAINYCIRRINKSDQKFLEESFQLYNELVENEIIFINDELSPWDFKNIIVLALRLGKYNWTEGFILNYNHKLPETSRENAVTYNLAQLYFYQKQYEKVIEQLQNVEYEDVSYNLNSKSMLIATYYEMDEIEPLYSLFESFRAYLNRHKDISNERRKLYSNLIRITKKLTKLSPGDAKSLEKIKTEMTQTKNIASANWLKEKISELEGV
jgi:tetratricopeptide (TPR) repeat protein